MAKVSKRLFYVLAFLFGFFCCQWFVVEYWQDAIGAEELSSTKRIYIHIPSDDPLSWVMSEEGYCYMTAGWPKVDVWVPGWAVFCTRKAQIWNAPKDKWWVVYREGDQYFHFLVSRVSKKVLAMVYRSGADNRFYVYDSNDMIVKSSREEIMGIVG